MDDFDYIGHTAEVMKDNTPLPIQIRIVDAWLIISALQLAVRHPGLSSWMKGALRDIAEQFSAPIIAAHPQAKELIARGWNTDYDIE